MIPDWLNLLFWARLPMLAGRVSPTVGSVMTDGVYLARESFVGGTLPMFALGLGLLSGARHAGETFTASLLIMGFLGAAGMLSAQLGLWGSFGYVIGDLVVRDRAFPGSAGVAALLLSYALLTLLTVYLPLLVGAVRLRLRKLDEKGQVAMILEALAAAVTAGVGAWAWTQALRVLIAPVYTWQGLSFDAPDIVPLVQRWGIIVAVVATAAAFRVWRELLGRSDIVRSHAAQLRVNLAPPRPERVRWPEPVSIGLGALLLTLLLAGLVASVAQTLVVIAFFAVLLWGRRRLAEFVWPRGLSGIPALARGALALALGFALSGLFLPGAVSSTVTAGQTALTASRAALRTAGSTLPPASPSTPTLTPALWTGSWSTLVAACVTVGLVALAVTRPRTGPPTAEEA